MDKYLGAYGAVNAKEVKLGPCENVNIFVTIEAIVIFY